MRFKNLIEANVLQKAGKILNIIYGLMAVLFVLSIWTRFDIKNQEMKSFIYFGFLPATIVILVWNLFFIKPRLLKIAGVAIPLLMIVLCRNMDPLRIIFSSGAWHTQTILYRNANSRLKT